MSRIGLRNYEDLESYEDRLSHDNELFSRCSFRGEDGTYSRRNHWKFPLRVVVESDEVAAMKGVIRRMVGGLDKEVGLGDGLVRLESKGYYHHIGA